MNLKISTKKWVANNEKRIKKAKQTKKTKYAPITEKNLKHMGMMDFKINMDLYN